MYTQTNATKTNGFAPIALECGLHKSTLSVNGGW